MQLPEPIANLQREHGHIRDVAEELGTTLTHGGDISQVEAITRRLLSLLEAHGAAEDLGVYPDLVTRLGGEGGIASWWRPSGFGLPRDGFA